MTMHTSQLTPLNLQQLVCKEMVGLGHLFLAYRIQPGDKFEITFEVIPGTEVGKFTTVEEAYDLIYSFLNSLSANEEMKSRFKSSATDPLIRLVYENWARNEIARKSYRGPGNHMIGNVVIYVGGTEIDRPFNIECRGESEYVVFRHPDWQKYCERLSFG